LGLTVLDASVLIALFDAQDACHHAAMAAVASRAGAQDSVLVPATALSEALVAPYKKGPPVGRQMEPLVDALGSVAEVTREIARRAARLRARSPLKLPDALIVATGQECGASEILTFDARWKNVDRRVRVLPPAQLRPG
jgi:predicted nucleic acid-binding protein